MCCDSRISFLLLLSLLFVCLTEVAKADNSGNEAKPDGQGGESSNDDDSKTENLTSDSDEPTPKEKIATLQELEYNKGSLCGYCTYCKFCKLCDRDCPCEKSPSKPNCHMCKYCKFCYLCKLACETICQPGGIVDIVSSAVYNQLPRFNKVEVDRDLEDVKDWIDKAKEEL